MNAARNHQGRACVLLKVAATSFSFCWPPCCFPSASGHDRCTYRKYIYLSLLQARREPHPLGSHMLQMKCFDFRRMLFKNHSSPCPGAFPVVKVHLRQKIFLVKMDYNYFSSHRIYAAKFSVTQHYSLSQSWVSRSHIQCRLLKPLHKSKFPSASVQMNSLMHWTSSG